MSDLANGKESVTGQKMKSFSLIPEYLHSKYQGSSSCRSGGGLLSSFGANSMVPLPGEEAWTKLLNIIARWINEIGTQCHDAPYTLVIEIGNAMMPLIL